MNEQEIKAELRAIQSEGYDWIAQLGDLIRDNKLIEAGNTKNEGFALFDRIGVVQNMAFGCINVEVDDVPQCPIVHSDVQFNGNVQPWEFTWNTVDSDGNALPTDGELKYGTVESNLDQTTGGSGTLFDSHRKYQPNQGQSGGQLNLAADTNYFYTICSTDADGNECEVSGSFSTPVLTSFDWNNTLIRPDVSASATVYELHSENTATSNLTDFLGTSCTGPYYRINASATEDVVIKMAAGSGSLKYPIWVVGGRDHHFLGIDLKLELQPGCDIGEGTLITAYGADNRNINPLVVGGMAIRSEATRNTILEGSCIDMMGLEGDPLVIRNYDRASGGSTGTCDRDIYILNSRLVGNDSLDQVAGVGDSSHGDTMHDQTASTPDECFRALYVENVTARASGNGLLFQGREGPLVNTVLKNYSWDLDYRFHGTRAYESTGLGFNIRTSAFSFDNVWLARSQEASSLDYGIIRNSANTISRHGASQTYNPSVIIEAGINGGVPSTEFAPQSETGLNYVSPF